MGTTSPWTWPPSNFTAAPMFESVDDVLENEEDLVTISIESELKITDVEWSDNLTDPDSEMYLDMQNELEGDMTDVFCDDEHGTFAMVDNDTCSIEVTNFTEGSVIIQFFLTKMELNSTLQKKADSDFLAEMGEKMNKKGLKKFKVDKKSLKIKGRKIKSMCGSAAPGMGEKDAMHSEDGGMEKMDKHGPKSEGSGHHGEGSGHHGEGSGHHEEGSWHHTKEHKEGDEKKMKNSKDSHDGDMKKMKDDKESDKEDEKEMKESDSTEEGEKKMEKAQMKEKLEDKKEAMEGKKEELGDKKKAIMEKMGDEETREDSREEEGSGLPESFKRGKVPEMMETKAEGMEKRAEEMENKAKGLMGKAKELKG